ncbi:MAG: phenylalanine--tRNA ligase subunit beta [Chloroflexota bacterium]
MKVPLKWLRDYVEIRLTPAEIADRLTMAGTEIGGMTATGGDWDRMVVGQITAVGPHPNADRLHLVTINIGPEQPTVVCGAPNLTVGDKVVFAPVGARLTDPHSGQVVTLKTAKIRGVESSGMACSEKELGISDNHEGIMVLSPEAPVGTPLTEYLGDTVLDAEVTPNRADCLSITGIAREVAALTGQAVRLPDLGYPETGPAITEVVSVEIADPDLCRRYCASLVTGIRVGESPPWLQQRLLACGMRPINNVVDITNYVMLEYGQPLHSFDYHQVSGGKIVVRRAAAGEVLVSLDGVDRALTTDMLVIADGERAVAIGGVMGGANSEVTGGTTAILLEAASFNPANIHYTGRTLSLPSEACLRFERGISPELTVPALRRATQLILELAGGQAARGIIDVYPGRVETPPIRLTTARVKQLLGVEFSLDQIISALSALGFTCAGGSADPSMMVTPPYWRTDVKLAEDLVEEVARVQGYDKIAITMLSQPIPQHDPAPMPRLKARVGQALVGYGFQEIISYSLTSLKQLGRLLPEPHPLEPAPIPLANPLSADQEVLRPSLRPNLLAALVANRRHEDNGIRLFEMGRVYLPGTGELPDERDILGAVLSGPRQEASWHGGGGNLDFYDTKGVVEGLFRQLGVAVDFTTANDDSFAPGKQAAIVVAGNRLGVIGELHPRVLQAFEIPETTCLLEIDLAAPAPLTAAHPRYQPVPRFPATVRDLALVVEAAVTHRRVLDTLQGFSLLTQVSLFDVYTGGQLPPGKKSLAYRLAFQSPERTLTDQEVDQVEQQILARLAAELGATRRA